MKTQTGFKNALSPSQPKNESYKIDCATTSKKPKNINYEHLNKFNKSSYYFTRPQNNSLMSNQYQLQNKFLPGINHIVRNINDEGKILLPSLENSHHTQFGLNRELKINEFNPNIPVTNLKIDTDIGIKNKINFNYFKNRNASHINNRKELDLNCNEINSNCNINSNKLSKNRKKSVSPSKFQSDKNTNFNLSANNYYQHHSNNNNLVSATQNNLPLNTGGLTTKNFFTPSYSPMNNDSKNNNFNLTNNLFANCMNISSKKNKKFLRNESELLSEDLYPMYNKAKHSDNSCGIIAGYGTNTYRGLIRNYNEDRVSVILNVKNPKLNKEKKSENVKESQHLSNNNSNNLPSNISNNVPNNASNNLNNNWGNISYFAIFDGHAGNHCADFLKLNLHHYIFESDFFPNDPKKAIESAFNTAEKNFIDSVHKNREYTDYSGDSRALYSENSGEKLYQISRDHKPNGQIEKKRIAAGGGSIYQLPGIYVGITMPYRILPGNLSVSRAIGDVEAKIPLLGGNPKVLIPQPCVNVFDITSESDFIILGCDGIYDKVNNEEIFETIWKFKEKGKSFMDIHSLSGKITDAVMKLSLKKLTSDNISCIFICFDNFKKDMMDNDFEHSKFYNGVELMKGEIDLSGFDPNYTPVKKQKFVMPNVIFKK